jgi:hypothetical protein
VKWFPLLDTINTDKRYWKDEGEKADGSTSYGFIASPEI